MPKYHVHVYPIVRVLVPDVEADSQEEACQKAEAAWNWEAVLRQAGNERGWPAVEYSDDINGFLVDEDGDTEHESSTWYDAEYAPL
jgi:hypothetical protein